MVETTDTPSIQRNSLHNNKEKEREENPKGPNVEEQVKKTALSGIPEIHSYVPNAPAGQA